MKWVFILLILALTINQAYAAATIADIYSAPSEAQQFSSGTAGICQDLDPSCSDEEYSSVTDVYSKLGDGSTSSSSSVVTRNSGNSQAAYIKLVYDIDGLFSGTYSLRFATTDADTFVGLIYSYKNDTNVNVSSEIVFTKTQGDTWTEVDITDIVNQQALNNNGRVMVKLYSNESSSTSISEAYLRRPFRAEDFDIVSQGVEETELDRHVINGWLVVSRVSEDITSVSNLSCELWRLDDGGIYFDLNETALNLMTDINGRLFEVMWDANETHGVEEGKNIELNCMVNANGVEFENIKQFIYVNNQKSILDNIQDFIVYIAQILGLLQDNNDMLNELLLELQIGATEYLPGDPGKIFAKILQENIELENAACEATMHYPNGTKFITGAVMEPVIDVAATAQSYFQHDFIVPEVIGVYPVTVACSLNATETFYDVIPPTITVNQGTFVSGANTDLAVRDGVFYSNREQAKRHDLEFEFIGINVTNQTTALTFHFDAQRLFGGAGDPANDTIHLSIWNYTSSSWILVASPYAYTSGVFPFTLSTDTNIDDFVSSDGNFTIRFEDTVGPPTDNSVNTLLEIDRIIVSTVEIGGTLPADLIKSSSEVHVNPPPIEMDLSEGMFYTGQTATISNVLYWSNAPAFSIYSFISDAECFLAIHYPNGTSWQILAMNVTNGGVYVTDVTFPEDVSGNYISRASCQGGSLPKLARDSSTLIVHDGVTMVSIT